jgi:hypothetical protein
MYKNLLLLIALFLGGCADIKQTIYLQNAEVNGPLNHPPIYISDNRNGITVSPWLSFSSRNQVTGRTNHSRVNINGVYQLDTIYEGGQIYYRESNANQYEYTKNNVKWNLPNVKGGVDIDLPISRTVSIIGSFNYVSQNLYQIVGGSFGFGFYSVKNNNAIRLNIGCTLQEYQYDAETAVVSTIDPLFGREYSRTDIFHDIDKKSSLNFFGNLTYNSVSETMPINFFFSFAFFSQTLLNIEPQNPNREYYPFGITTTTTDERGETSTAYLSFTPGIYMNITPTMRLVLGINLVKDIGGFMSATDSFSSKLFVMPLAKVDLLF